MLPFASSGDDDGIADVGDSVAEAVIGILSRNPFIEVAAMASGFRFRGPLPEPEELGEALGVRYVLQGGVRARGGQLRVSVHLGDTRTGREIWSDRLTRPLDDLFAVEDEISGEVALGIEAQLVGGTQLRKVRTPTTDLDAYAELMKGTEAYVRFRRDSNLEARRHLFAALEHDPALAQVHAFLAWTYATEAHFGWSSDRAASLRAAREQVDRSLELDPDLAMAVGARGHILMLSGDYEDAIAVTDRALRLDPRSADACHIQAMNMLYAGRFSEAATLERHALALSPLDRVLLDNARAILAAAECHLGRFEQALEVADQCLTRNPAWLFARVSRAVALKQLDRHGEAELEARRILQLNPRFSTTWWRTVHPYRLPEELDPIVEILVAIGLPAQTGESSLEPAELPTAEPGPVDGRWLATLLLTDIVNSTELASEMGDRAWREKIEMHDQVARDTVEDGSGRTVKMTGDGILAMFDHPGQALGCSIALRARLAAHGLEVRAGIHTGEVEVAADEVRGLGVHITARVSALAGPNEILATSTVKDLVAGSGHSFSPQGRHELRGVPDAWQLFSLEA